MLIADADANVRSALRLLLRREPHLRIVGEAADGQELLACATNTCPDLVLLDWALPGLQLSRVVGRLHDTCPRAAVVALSVRPERRRDVLASGATAFVSKADPPTRLLAILEVVLGARVDACRQA